ncbi:MAG: GNAT family N-acetyltransferase [Planctomycetota bacterium]
MSKPKSAFATLAGAEPPSLAHGPVPSFESQSSAYRVRFARDEADLDAICRLRFAVFNLELGEGLDQARTSGVDLDEFDRQCQHLMVETIPAAGGAVEVVGTYRLQTAESARTGAGFYSAEEFELESMPDELLDNAIELGRACVRADHRNRRVLFLLWRGLAAYVLWHRKRWFFGCNSLNNESEFEGWRMMQYLVDHDHIHPELHVEPRPDYRCAAPPLVEGPPDEDAEATLPLEIPPLFGIYLRYGAKICGPPAHDRLFHTIDFFTVVDLDRMDERTFNNFAQDR